MNDVMTINTATLANKDLKKHLNEIKKAVETIGANRWKVADALRKIAENDEYKEDFKTDTALAEALGMKRQNFQKLVKASKYHAECKSVDEDGNVTLLLDGFSVSAVFEIIVIPIDDVPTFFDCMSGTEYEVTKELLTQLRGYLEEGIDPEVIFKEQRDQLIADIKDYCNTPTRKSIWKALKESSGFTGKLEEMPLSLMKELYKKLTEE